jgi:CheY-like chemotaxis protein/anti-sigma regulatory factor (Ser/Thr protein kinase)
MEETSGQYFLSSLSHELRTPLNGIVGYTQLLSQTKIDKNQLNYLNSMKICCLQLVELVNDILDFSKLATGKAQINNECFHIKEMIEAINSTLEYKLKEKKQKLSYILSKNIPEYIIADKQKILQVLINLISNSIKFSNDNTRIIVSIDCDEEKLSFSVEDNGIGISRENQEKLFNPFYQVQETLIKNGSGLGLAICKKIVNLLEGDIYVESEKGEGCIFYFNVKYENYDNYENSLENNLKILKNKFVLLVDNDIENRLLLSEILFDVGMYVIICSTPKEAIRMINGKRYQFSAMIINCNFEVSLVKQLKDISSDLRIIGYCDEKDVSRYNLDCVLYKPVNKIKLLSSIYNIVSKDDISMYSLNEDDFQRKQKNIKDIQILVAEDVDYNLELLNSMLKELGYSNIDNAKDGEEAINKLKQKSYDILILDLKMPKKDGFEVAEYIKNNSIKDVKICILTASVLENDKIKCKNLGIKYFLLKPVNMNHLKKILNL